MTTLLAPPSTTGPDPGPVLLPGARLHAVLDALDADYAGLGTREVAAEVHSLEGVLRRVEALKLRLLAHANTTGIAKATGMSGTDAWLARAARSGRGESARQVRLATALDEGLDLTATALGEGKLSCGHAAVIADATAKLPAGLSAGERAGVEAALVAKAEQMSPAELRRAGRRALEAITTDQARVDAHENTVLEGEETNARARAELAMWDNRDGTVSGRFTVPHLAGAILRRAIETMTSPRRAALGATQAQSGPVGYDADAMGRRAGAAFIELLEHLPTDRLYPKTAATIVVTINETQLRGRVAAAGLDTGERLSAGDLRRVACGASILPVILNGKSLVIDVGTTRRLFTETQRLALGLTHTSCAAEGCQRPYSWCEIHHRIPWQHDGPTNLNNAIPLCGFHHQRIHDPTYHHQYSNTGVTFHRRT